MIPNSSAQLYWIDNFAGIIQRQDPDKIPVNCSPLLKNISLGKIGSYVKRSGTDRLATTQAGNGVFGLIEYIPNNGVNAIHAVRSTDLDSYNSGTNAWDQIDSAQFTASTKISSVNFNNRVYHISPSNNLCYETGGTCTDVGSGGNEIRAKLVATAQKTLFVGNVTTIAGGGVSYQDRVYYSDFTGINEKTDTLYDADQTMATSQRWFSCDEPVVAMCAFGVPDSVIHIFTKNRLLRFDIRQESAAVGVVEIFKYGIAGQDAWTICNNNLVWMDPDGRILVWDGFSPEPVIASFTLEDDTYGESIISKIDKTQIDLVAAGSTGSTFRFSVGNITYYGETLNNCELVGLITPDKTNIFWSLNSYPVRPFKYINATLGGEKKLLFGVNNADDIYETNVGGNDEGTAIDAFARTMFTDCDVAMRTKDAIELWVKYRPSSIDTNYIKVSYAVDGEFSYTPFSDPDNVSPVNDYGVINTYDLNSAVKTDKMAVIKFPPGVEFRTLSIELRNSQSNELMDIAGIGIVYRSRPLNIRIDAS